MNQDFALLVTPANARRLLRLRRNNPTITLPAYLHEVASRECITETDFDPFICAFTEERATITQFLLDSGMRGIVQAPYHPAIDELTLLNVVRLARSSKLTIMSTRHPAWRRAAAAYNFADIKFATPREFSGADVEARRDGVLIVDLKDSTLVDPYHRYAREFPRMLFYESCDVPLHFLRDWTALATVLFPTMPHPWAITRLSDNPRQWANMQLTDFALFYNFCLFPEYR